MADSTTLAPEPARTPLLDLIRDGALEQEYLDAAAHRGNDRGGAVGERRGRLAGLVVIAVFGLLVTVAAIQTSRNADVQEASRAQVISRIEENRAGLQSDQATAAELREANAEAEATLVELGGQLGAAEARADRIGAQSGFAAVTGPGLRITFDNAAAADPLNEWVRDSDLAALVNGLWNSGAEAIAINGQRLTGVGGIRNVGQVVRINNTAIQPPYVVTAIGDPDRLAAELPASEGGQTFYGLAQSFGWAAPGSAAPDTRMVTDARIPAAPARVGQLRSAHRPDEQEGDAQ